MSPRTSVSNQKIRDERRDQILHTALKVFAYKGFKATKISDIATQAGISQGLIHHYFASKDEVFTAVIERAMSGALAAFDESAGPDPDPWARLAQITERMLQGLVIHPEYMLVLTQSLVSEDTPPDAGKFVATLGQQVNSKLTELIKAGQAAGQVVPGNPDELAMTFMATVQGLAITQFTQGLFTMSSSPASPNFLPSPGMVLRLLKA
ncbi:MAG TPA: TetR/AcrR family transcriptional regulator [Anaerolineales bacterium]|nr:TetR/AcrR family transcriptional regulator [Anaerolineales bacterium]